VRGIAALIGLLFEDPGRLALAHTFRGDACVGRVSVRRGHSRRIRGDVRQSTTLPEHSLHILALLCAFTISTSIDVTPISFCVGMGRVAAFIGFLLEDPGDFALAFLVCRDFVFH